MTSDVNPEKIRCDACPVMCFIAEGKSGACDRYANHDGGLIRLDPLTIIQSTDKKLVPFMKGGDMDSWDGDIIKGQRPFVTAVGAGTTYPDYKPAPFIVSQNNNGVDMVTVVTEGIFSYCGVKVKIDTDRHLGHERDVVYADGEPIGHVTTSEGGGSVFLRAALGWEAPIPTTRSRAQSWQRPADCVYDPWQRPAVQPASVQRAGTRRVIARRHARQLGRQSAGLGRLVSSTERRSYLGGPGSAR